MAKSINQDWRPEPKADIPPQINDGGFFMSIFQHDLLGRCCTGSRKAHRTLGRHANLFSIALFAFSDANNLKEDTMNEKANWSDYDSLYAQTEAIANAVNDELLARLSEQKPYVVINDKTASDLMWAVVDGMRRLREIESTFPRQGHAEANGVMP